MELKLLLLLLTLLQPNSIATSEETFENSTDLCTKRCTCELSRDNQTLYVYCANKQMEHTIANWPEHPQNLMAIFSNNHIATLEKMPGSGATDIKLIFSNCSIKYLDSGLFESAVNVKFLDLSHNLIEREQLSSDVFKGPYNNTTFEPIALEHLDLSYNQIHSLPKNLFEHTPNLKYLNLESNLLRVIDHVSCIALGKAVHLQILNLAKNQLTALPGDAIKHFPNLTEIDLSRNGFVSVPETLGFVSSSLQILNISNNPIVELDHNSFEGMENLLTLAASNLNELSEIRARTFTPLKHLKVLEMAHNKKLKDVDEEAFAKIDELEEVYLNNNSLIRISVNLLPWYQIRILNLHDNELVCDCDLYNVSRQLSHIFKRGVNAPSCLDQRSYLNVEIDSLTNETCSFQGQRGRRRGVPRTYADFRVMRITLTTLIITLILSASVVMWLGYTKWRMYRRNTQYPFPSQIIYSPVATTDFPRF